MFPIKAVESKAKVKRAASEMFKNEDVAEENTMKRVKKEDICLDTLLGRLHLSSFQAAVSSDRMNSILINQK